jgi:hypothetical protein
LVFKHEIDPLRESQTDTPASTLNQAHSGNDKPEENWRDYASAMRHYPGNPMDNGDWSREQMAAPIRAALEPEHEEKPCEEADGCPTERARLKREWREMRAALEAKAEPVQPVLTVKVLSFPESNGKRNWTAMLTRVEKWGGLIGNCGGITIARGELWNRVAYEAEQAKALLRLRPTEPHILDYGDDIETPEEWAGEVRGGEEIEASAPPTTAEIKAHLSKEDLPILRRLRDEKADFARRIDEANPDDRYAALIIHEDVAYLDDLLERLTALVSDR